MQVKHTSALTDEAARVIAYHDRTKHRLDRYAAGPETLDWDLQPDPFREYAGTRRIALPLGAARFDTPFSAIYQTDNLTAQPVTLESVSALLELSMGLSAWKEYGPDRWALRCNPSSGNLHPTEAYITSRNVPDLDNGIYHYISRDHALEQRAAFAMDSADTTCSVLIGLTSIHWREAWKYGERAFRYCQLDMGHALGAMRYAAGVLGWQLRLLDHIGSDELATLLGTDRSADYVKAEREEADLLLEIIVKPDSGPRVTLPLLANDHNPIWYGTANTLDRHPMYRWPVIDDVAEASRKPQTPACTATPANYPLLSQGADDRAATLILQRRSAQRFDAKTVMPQADFYRMLDHLLPRRAAPWDIWNVEPRVHPVLFVHRVQGLEPGLYALPRSSSAEHLMRSRLHPQFLWQKAPPAPAHLPLYLLTQTDCRTVAKTISCRQGIAGDGCFSLGMLAEFDATVTAEPWRYRQLHWEAGLLGQVLYLEAELSGMRGTGIGCFMDDSFHEMLGISGKPFQSIYHFTVGQPVLDERILTQPPYPGRGTQATR